MPGDAGRRGREDATPPLRRSAAPSLRRSAAPPPPRVVYPLLLALVVLLALVPRLWLWFDQGSAGMVYPGDQDEYYRGAIHLLLEGSYYDDGQWLRPPLMSLFLAGIFALVGVNVPLAMLVQCGLSALTLLLLAAMARSLFASRRAGVVAALMGALFLPYASYASQLLSETLFTFMIAAVLLLFEMARTRGMAWRWLLAGGVVWGLAALTRPVGVYALPLLMVWAAFGTGSFRPLSVAVGRALLIVLGFVLVVAPWTIRNYAVYGQVVLVDTNGGISFWLGNLLEPGERELQQVWNETIPNSAVREDVAMARAIENIRREPLTFISRMRYKTVSLWQLDTRLFVGNAPIGITLDERSLPFAVASDVQYVLIMLLALVGVAVARPAERNLALLVWPLYGTLISAVSLGHPRLRLPLLVVVLVYAALPLAHPREVWQRLREATWYRWGALLVGVGIFAFLIYASAYRPFVHSQFWLGVAQATGRTSAIERAIAAAPDNYLPYVALGHHQREQGNLRAALDAYNQAAERAPQNTFTHLQRLALFRMLGDAAGAEEAMAAVASVGWDNNQTYAWAWQHMPANAGTVLDVAAPAPGILQGFYAAEHEGGQAVRWTRGRAQIRLGLLPPSAATLGRETRLRLRLRADFPDTPVRISYQYSDLLTTRQEVLDTVRVGTSWHTYTLPVGEKGVFTDNPFGYTGVVTLQSPARVASTDAPYPRGVALAGAWLEYVPEE